jgi:hypothetical protein
MVSPKLIAFGYWRSLYQPQLPDPACFVDTTWPAAERQQVLAYLRQGRSLISFMGFSWCRFRCGAGREMGAADMTDGTCLWPEGLIHYIEKHHLRLPDEIIQRIFAQAEFPVERAAAVSQLSEGSYDWWLTQKGWQPNFSSFLSAADEDERAYLRRYERGQIDFSDHSPTAHQAREQLAANLRQKYHPLQ